MTEQEPPNPQDVPVLSYYTPPKRRSPRVTVRHTRGLVIAMAGLLLGTLYAAGVSLLSIGPQYPTVIAHKPVGISDLSIAIALADKLSGGEYNKTIYERVLNYLHEYGMTVLDGPVPSGRSQQAVLETFRIDEVRKDPYNVVMWSKLPTGWLAIGTGSIRFWPDQGNWHTETWWKSSDGPQPPEISEEGSTRLIYDLPGHIRGDITGGGAWSSVGLQYPPGIDWQASMALRVALWGAVVLGAVIVVAALRTRKAGGPQWALAWCLAWTGLMAGLFCYAGWAIVPLADVFQVWSVRTPPAQFRVFGLLLAPGVAGLLLSAALWLHRRMARL